MKRLLTIFFLILCIAGCLIFGIVKINNDNKHSDYLRIHIRANSNLEVDQEVKYKVKDAIVDYLTPKICECDSKEELIDIIEKNLNEIECISNEILAQNNFDYFTTALINNEYFPIRSYDGFTLENGYYDALIINLGSGKGNNWWCVVYPPLCFVNSNTNYKYKSRVVEIIKKYFGGI